MASAGGGLGQQFQRASGAIVQRRRRLWWWMVAAAARWKTGRPHLQHYELLGAVCAEAAVMWQFVGDVMVAWLGVLQWRHGVCCLAAA